LAWRIEVAGSAERQLGRLDKQVARRIINFLRERVSTVANPRKLGKSLQGPLGEYWQYRVGDYRIIVDIQDSSLVVLVVAVGDRKQIHRQFRRIV
jgi:mRNA interferase RelE/StbE